MWLGSVAPLARAADSVVFGRGLFVAFAVEWAAAQDWAPSTRAASASSLKRIEHRIGAARRLDQVDELVLDKLRQSLTADYALKTATITLHYAASVMRAAYRMRRIPRPLCPYPTKGRGCSYSQGGC